MNRLLAALTCIVAFGATGVGAQSVAPSKDIAAVLASPTRTPANRARDRYRHPAQTLAFFGVKPTQTIVEFLPAGGWYAEILAPLVKGRGHMSRWCRPRRPSAPAAPLPRRPRSMA